MIPHGDTMLDMTIGMVRWVQSSAPDLPTRVSDIVQYLTSAGVIALIVMLNDIRGRLGKVETQLNGDKLGLVDRFVQTSERVHTHANDILGINGRLDGHDQRLDHIESLIERRKR